MLTLTGASDVLKRLVATKHSSNEVRRAYLALSLTEGNINGGGITEPTALSYARALIGRSGQNQTPYYCFTEPAVAEDGVSVYIENNVEIHFNEVQESLGWGEIGYFAIYETETGGTPIYVGKLKEVIDPTVNTVPLARKGNIKITLSPGA